MNMRANNETVRQYDWLCRAIQQIRKSSLKKIPLLATQTETMPDGQAFMYMQWSKAAGLIQAGNDGPSIYIYESNLTKGLPADECMRELRKMLHLPG